MIRAENICRVHNVQKWRPTVLKLRQQSGYILATGIYFKCQPVPNYKLPENVLHFQYIVIPPPSHRERRRTTTNTRQRSLKTHQTTSSQEFELNFNSKLKLNTHVNDQGRKHLQSS